MAASNQFNLQTSLPAAKDDMIMVWKGLGQALSICYAKEYYLGEVFSLDFFRWFLSFPFDKKTSGIIDMSEIDLFHLTLPLLEGPMLQYAILLKEFLEWDIRNEFEREYVRWEPFYERDGRTFRHRHA